MSTEVKRTILEKLRQRYLKASKRQKSLILDEFCATCDLSRKHAIRLLNHEIRARAYHPGPKYRYGPEAREQVLILWRAMGCICSKKMAVALKLWLPFYDGCSPAIKFLLHQISSSTIDRILQKHRNELARGKTSTVVSLIKNKIPIQLLDHKVTEPGFIEANTVGHCGTSMAGEFANTLTMTDLFSAWTENGSIRTCRRPA